MVENRFLCRHRGEYMYSQSLTLNEMQVNIDADNGWFTWLNHLEKKIET